MGQAKQRGARADRVAEALGLKKRNLDELKIDLGLPDEAIFCGYVVHIEAADEFLASVKETPLTVERTFAKTPELAIRYDEFVDAYEVARVEKGEIVVILFDVGSQFQVFTLNN